MIRMSTVHLLGAKIKKKTSQHAHQADVSSPLKALGETHLQFTRNGKEFHVEGFVIGNLDVEILAGTPFMEVNDVSIRHAKHQIIIGDNIICTYGTSTTTVGRKHAIRRAHVLRAISSDTV